MNIRSFYYIFKCQLEVTLCIFYTYKCDFPICKHGFLSLVCFSDLTPVQIYFKVFEPNTCSFFKNDDQYFFMSLTPSHHKIHFLLFCIIGKMCNTPIAFFLKFLASYQVLHKQISGIPNIDIKLTAIGILKYLHLQ